jgi:hypothetical protein
MAHLIDFCSAFPYETFWGHVKMLVRSPNKVLTQIVKRISELEKVSKMETTIKNVFLTIRVQ